MAGRGGGRGRARALSAVKRLVIQRMGLGQCGLGELRP